MQTNDIMKTLASVGLAAALIAGCDAGPQGPPGPPGNANVHTVTVNFVLADAALVDYVASSGYTVPSITPSVVSHGAVLAYFRDQGTWTALPFTLGIENPDTPIVDYTFTLGYAFDEAFFEIFIEASTPDDVVWNDILRLLPAEYVVKVVVIDGFSLAQAPGLDVQDYESVRDYFALPEH